MTDSQQQITTETALRLLIKPLRRQVLRWIAETSDSTTVDQLSKRLGGTDSTPTDHRSPENRSIELQHVHLPMLQEANVIAYTTVEGIIQRGREFQSVLSLLRTIDDHREDASTRLS
jgi:DNA-binding transcriptional ArsR family regulator